MSDEQRKQMREQMEAHRIRKVTRVEITEAAFKKGRALIEQIDLLSADPARIDSLIKNNNGRIIWTSVNDTPAQPVARQLLDAYMNTEVTSLKDNVQLIRTQSEDSDSILYTKPVVDFADNAGTLKGVWNIWLSKKELVLAMKKK